MISLIDIKNIKKSVTDFIMTHTDSIILVSSIMFTVLMCYMAYISIERTIEVLMH